MNAQAPVFARRAAAVLLAAGSCAFFAVAARASPALPDAAGQVLQQQGLDAQLCGSGNYRFFGFGIYRAALYGACSPDPFAEPFALTLQYQRNFTREQIVESSIEEIRRVSENAIAESTLQAWAGHMRAAFTDVADGDRLTGVYLPGQGAVFMAGEQRTSSVQDPEFARWFFSIWLDRRTRAPGLRSELLAGAS